MRRKRRCPYCHESFRPNPKSYRITTGKYEQRVCSDQSCQKKRRLEKLKKYWRDNPLVGSSLKSYQEQQQKWRQENGQDYMRGYRRKKKGYVKRNRALQRVRDRKRRNLVKQAPIWVKRIDTLRQIQRFPMLVKQDPIPQVQARQINAICRYLIWQNHLVKQSPISLQKKIKHNRGHEKSHS